MHQLEFWGADQGVPRSVIATRVGGPIAILRQRTDRTSHAGPFDPHVRDSRGA
jgi:hypothetical protein